MKIAIIGGGIGGLTTALALKKAGVNFKLYEAAPEIKAVGAGIIMANNALQVFRKLGIHEKIYAKGNRIDAMDITKGNFSPLSSVRLDVFVEKYGLQNHAIHRADLHTILVEAVGEEHIEINRRLTDIQKKENGYQLSFEEGTEETADFIIGADGIRSVVRQKLYDENEYRNSGQLCWRGVVEFDLPSEYQHRLIEAWSGGKRFGFVRISEKKVYWYLLINDNLGDLDADHHVFTKGFHPIAEQLVWATPQEKVIKAKLYDVKPIRIWQKENTCLVGDAAHAMTPNLGQGACQAIEDAYVLGELVAKYDVMEAFVKYPEVRRAKATSVVNRSWKFGKIAHLNHPLAEGIRNSILKYATPRRMNKKMMDKLFTLDKIS